MTLANLQIGSEARVTRINGNNAITKAFDGNGRCSGRCRESRQIRAVRRSDSDSCARL